MAVPDSGIERRRVRATGEDFRACFIKIVAGRKPLEGDRLRHAGALLDRLDRYSRDPEHMPDPAGEQVGPAQHRLEEAHGRAPNSCGPKAERT